LLEHLVVEQQRQRRVAGLVAGGVGSRAGLPAHVVAVGQAEVVVEAVVRRQEGRLVAAVPFADHLRPVAGVGQEPAEADLRRRESHALTGEQHRETVERAEADPGRIAPRQERAPRRRADRRGHVERVEADALVRHPVERRGRVGR
jgi:hypothetical protein